MLCCYNSSKSNLGKRILQLRVSIKKLHIQAKKTLKEAKAGEQAIKQLLFEEKNDPLDPSSRIYTYAQSVIEKYEEYNKLRHQIAYLEKLVADADSMIISREVHRLAKTYDKHHPFASCIEFNQITSIEAPTSAAKSLVERLLQEVAPDTK